MVESITLVVKKFIFTCRKAVINRVIIRCKGFLIILFLKVIVTKRA